MKELLKEFGRAFFIGSLIFLVLRLIDYLGGDFDLTASKLLWTFAYNQLYSVILYGANALFIRYILKRFGADFYKGRKLVLAISGSIGVTMVSIFFIRIITEVWIEGEAFKEFLAGETLQFYYVSLIISMVVAGIFYVFYYYKYRQESQVKEQRIIAKTASAQFDALKNQLDPHFLFNSLNVLTSLIEENPQAATRFTTALSKVYRYVLEQKNKQLVPVEEELRFARLYMSLIEMRFEDSIVFQAPKSVSFSEAKVVPLSLQLLLENAVKHNQVTPGKKLHITIFEEEGCLVVRNTIQPKAVVRESAGVGLENIRQRYGLLTNRPVEVTQTRQEFEVRIPMLTRSSVGIRSRESYIKDKRYEMARKKVEELKGFYIHFAIYLIMVPVFIFLNVRSTSYPWAIFPIAGWGVGVLGHAAEVFGWNPFFNKKWEERQIRKYMEDDR